MSVRRARHVGVPEQEAIEKWTPEQKRRQEVVVQIYNTELDYVEDILTLLEVTMHGYHSAITLTSVWLVVCRAHTTKKAALTQGLRCRIL